MLLSPFAAKREWPLKALHIVLFVRLMVDGVILYPGVMVSLSVLVVPIRVPIDNKRRRNSNALAIQRPFCLQLLVWCLIFLTASSPTVLPAPACRIRKPSMFAVYLSFKRRTIRRLSARMAPGRAYQNVFQVGHLYLVTDVYWKSWFCNVVTLTFLTMDNIKQITDAVQKGP